MFSEDIWCFLPWLKISTLTLSISISFLLLELWLQRIFVFPESILNPTFSVLCLISHNIFCICSQAYGHSFFCQRGRSSFKATCSTMLKSNRRNPHVDTPLLAFLFYHAVCRKVIQRLVRTTELFLIFLLGLVKPGIKSVVQDGRKQVCDGAGRTAN